MTETEDTKPPGLTAIPGGVTAAPGKPKVVIPAAFKIGPEQLERLRLAGGIIHDGDDFDLCTVPDPAYGEEVIADANLTPEETVLFVTMYVANDEVERLGRILYGDQVKKIGTAIQQGTEKQLTPESMSADANPDDVRAFFRNKRIAEYAHVAMFAMLEERLDLWDWQLGVRSKRRVVKVKRRY